MTRIQRLLAGSYVEPGLSAVQSIERAVDVDCCVAAGEPLLGALFGLAGAVHVNFGRTLAVSARIVTLFGSTSANPQATASFCSVEFSRYVISPTASSVMSGACPGRMPR